LQGGRHYEDTRHSGRGPQGRSDAGEVERQLRAYDESDAGCFLPSGI
jgi:hypothetical protein